MRSMVRSFLGLTLGAACAVAFLAPVAQATAVHTTHHPAVLGCPTILVVQTKADYYHESIYASIVEQQQRDPENVCQPNGQIEATAQLDFSGGNYPTGTLFSYLYRGTQLGPTGYTVVTTGVPNVYANTFPFVPSDNGCWHAYSYWSSDLHSVTGQSVCF